MRKITFFLTLLFAFATTGSNAQETGISWKKLQSFNASDAITDLSAITDGATVVFYNVNQSRYLKIDPFSKKIECTATAPSADDAFSGLYVFTLHKQQDGNYTMESAQAGYYMPAVNYQDTPDLFVETTPVPYIFSTNQRTELTTTAHEGAACASGQFVITSTVQYGGDSGCYGSFDCTADKFTGWYGKDSNCGYQIIPVQMSSEVITANYLAYNCTYNGVTFHTQHTLFMQGTSVEYPAIPDFSSRFLTCTTAQPTGNASASETVELVYEATDDLPVVATSIVDGAFAEGTTWYTVHLPTNTAGTRNMKLNGNGDTFASNSFESLFDEKAWFCFVGDPAHGYQIYSKHYGAGSPLNRSNDSPSINGNIATKWILVKAGDNVNVCDFDETGKWWNQLGGYNSDNFGFYSYGGSNIRFLNSVETANNVVAHSTFVQKKDHYIGGYSTETITAIQTEASTNGMTSKLHALINNSDKPEAGKYYYIRNVERDNGGVILGHSDDGTYAYGYSQKWNAGALYEFVPVPAENGFRLKNVNTGKYISALQAEAQEPGWNGFATLVEEGNAALFRLSYLGEGQNNIIDGNGSMMHCANRDYNWKLVAWTDGLNTASAWYIEEAKTIEIPLTTIGDASYATAYLPVTVMFEIGDEVYTAVQNSNNAAIIDPVEINNRVVPAGEGVIIKNTNKDATATPRIIYETWPKATDNLLTGSCLPINDITKTDYYIFGYTDANGLGFYRPNSTTLAANKAFINAGTSDVQFLKLNFGGDVTGIGEIGTTDSNDGDAPVFDLSGRRVEHASKGIYIRGGKKIYVK